MSEWVSFRNKVEGWFSSDVKPKLEAAETDFIAWAHNLLAQITPVLKQAATDAVAVAESTGGSASDKFASAETAVKEILTTAGAPIVENAIKGAIEIAVANL